MAEAALSAGLDVLTARFFRLRPFLGGAARCSSKNGLEWPSSTIRGRSMPVEKVPGGGDSGEEPGEGSVALESSTVEQVVVGEESLEPEAVELLRLC